MYYYKIATYTTKVYAVTDVLEGEFQRVEEAKALFPKVCGLVLIG